MLATQLPPKLVSVFCKHECRWMRLTIRTVPPLKSPKTNGLVNADGSSRIHKVTTMTVATGRSLNYGRIVKNRCKQAGLDLPALSPRKWGQRVPGTPFVYYKDKVYIEVLVHQHSETVYYLDGEQVDKSVVQPYLRLRNDSSSHGLPLKRKVVWRTISVDNIIAVKSGKLQYTAT